jgi:hypothetical protein
MHVKLEVETQPLSNLWVKLRRALRISFVLAAILAVNAAGVIFAFTWIPNHVRKADAGGTLSWGLSIFFTAIIWLALLNSILEHRQEARWRSN